MLLRNQGRIQEFALGAALPSPFLPSFLSLPFPSFPFPSRPLPSPPIPSSFLPSLPLEVQAPCFVARGLGERSGSPAGPGGAAKLSSRLLDFSYILSEEAVFHRISIIGHTGVPQKVFLVWASASGLSYRLRYACLRSLQARQTRRPTCCLVMALPNRTVSTTFVYPNRTSLALDGHQQYRVPKCSCSFRHCNYRLTRSSVVAETAQRFVSLNILLCHSRSLKVIRNDTVEQGVCKSLSIETMYVSCTVSGIFSVK